MSTVLAVLTALISVLTVGIPTLVESLSPHGSKINVALVRTGNDYPSPYKFDYQIYISNSGNRPGALGKVWVGADEKLLDNANELEIPEHYWPKDSDGIRKLELLAPGESRSLYFSRRKANTPLPEKAFLFVTIIEFDGIAKLHRLPILTGNALTPRG